MGRAMFDDITPPQNDPLEQDSSEDTPATESEPNTDTEQDDQHSIRNIAPLASQHRQERRARRAERRQLPTPENNARGNGGKKRRASRNFGKIMVWSIAILFLVGAFSAIGFAFIGKTTITLVPQQETITLSNNIVQTAYRTPEDSELGFTVVTTNIEATESVTATGSEVVEEKASGQIVVYNNYSSAPQRLIKNTRFEAPNGEIYRVRNSFVVPGKESSGAPGKIEVTVYADKPGADQNITVVGTKFTIPGLKGDPRYDGFHAELTTPITGGFIGERAIVDEDLLNATRTTLRENLRTQVSDAIDPQVGDEYILFDTAIFTTFESDPVAYGEGGSATVREIATISAVVFNENDIAKKLAQIALATPRDGAITIDSPESLVLNIVNQDTIDIASEALLQFTLEGRTALTWYIDTDSLKQDLVGKHSGALNTVMSGYPGIKSAQATIRPFWKSEFPPETERIAVEIVPEEK